MLEDYYLEFELEGTLDRYFLENGLLSVEPVPLYLNNEKIIPITKELFENDALISKNNRSKEISIKNTKTGHRLLLDTGNAPHLGIWAKPGAPYVCLEPWYSYDDSIDSNYDTTKKSGIMKIDRFTTPTRPSPVHQKLLMFFLGIEGKRLLKKCLQLLEKWISWIKRKKASFACRAADQNSACFKLC